MRDPENCQQSRLVRDLSRAARPQCPYGRPIVVCSVTSIEQLPCRANPSYKCSLILAIAYYCVFDGV